MSNVSHGARAVKAPFSPRNIRPTDYTDRSTWLGRASGLANDAMTAVANATPDELPEVFAWACSELLLLWPILGGRRCAAKGEHAELLPVDEVLLSAGQAAGLTEAEANELLTEVAYRAWLRRNGAANDAG